jgi:hypothetical protein
MNNRLAEVQADFDQFVVGFKTLQLASVSTTGQPEASYAPFIRLDGVWYVYISELAQHTKNILTTHRASVLLIEPEQTASNLFARKRVSFQMDAQEVSRETPDWLFIMDVFECQFGNLMQVLRGLVDFHLIAMKPRSGGFVRGFAQAFALGGDDVSSISMRRELGHRSGK